MFEHHRVADIELAVDVRAPVVLGHVVVDARCVAGRCETCHESIQVTGRCRGCGRVQRDVSSVLRQIDVAAKEKLARERLKLVLLWTLLFVR